MLLNPAGPSLNPIQRTDLPRVCQQMVCQGEGRPVVCTVLRQDVLRGLLVGGEERVRVQEVQRDLRHGNDGRSGERPHAGSQQGDVLLRASQR